jgi:hypothetical protein
MGDPAFFVGGEFWADPRWSTGRFTVPTAELTFLNGGEGAIRLICEVLKQRGIHEMLVPAYICSTMADAFDRYGMSYPFYRIQKDFRIDLDDLAQKAKGVQAVYAVNYFGYGFSAEEKEVLRRLRQQGKLIIEDNAQAILNRDPLGDFRFNTLRKFVPQDGSFFYSTEDVSTSLEKFRGLPNRRLAVMRQFRQRFAELLAEGAENFGEINPLFEAAEKYYYQDLTVWGDPQEREAALQLDWAGIERRRKTNHRRLMERLDGLEGIEIIFTQVSADSLPLGFPIYVKNGRREALLAHLREENVYPVVHWDITGDERLNHLPENVEKSSSIMTLILDQRFDEEDMDFEASALRRFFW